MSEQITCTQCGAAFTVPESVRERFPGWTPSRCRRCHSAARGKAGGDHADGVGASAKAGARQARRPVEENLTVAEVLERYTQGPQDGVFTDGSADPNPGPGGWGAVYVVDGEVVDQAFGHDPDTTNNRMEFTALIAGIDLVPPSTPATVYTDSRLAVDTITKWAPTWARNGWRRKSGPVQNLDLVKALHERARNRPEIEFAWVKAHAGTRWNEYADALSTAYRRDRT